MASTTKTALLWLTLISVIWMTACKKTSNSNQLVGTWNEVKVYTSFDSANIIHADTGIFASAPFATVTFTADGHYTGFAPPGSYVYGTYTFADTILTVYASSVYINPLLNPITETVSALQSGSMTVTHMDTFTSSGHQVTEKNIFYYTR